MFFVQQCLCPQKHATQRLRKSLKNSHHMTIQLHHGSLNQKIIRPEEASRMRCDTVATKNNKSRWPELYHKFVIWWYLDDWQHSSRYILTRYFSSSDLRNEGVSSSLVPWTSKMRAPARVRVRRVWRVRWAWVWGRQPEYECDEYDECDEPEYEGASLSTRASAQVTRASDT